MSTTEYRTIPSFTRYEINAEGQIRRAPHASGKIIFEQIEVQPGMEGRSIVWLSTDADPRIRRVTGVAELVDAAFPELAPAAHDVGLPKPYHSTPRPQRDDH